MFSCQKCDAQSPKWSGRCLECGAWGTLVEDVPSSVHQKTESKRGPARESVRLSLAKEGDASALRFPTGIGEVDRVIGGGLVQGSLVLLSGEPGIGKSTLVAMMAVSIAGRESGGGRMTRTSIPSLSTLHSPLSLPPLPPSHLLYVSGEESAGQLADRFARLGMKADSDIRFLEAMPIEEVVATVEKEKPRVAILDSVQTFPAATIEGGAGTATTVRYVANILLELAKKSGVTILLIGQVTKDGSVAGPKTLEHLVDVVLTLEGDPLHAYRILRGTKNRFGSTNEVGVFEMTEGGLIPVENPSARFLEERQPTPGSVITATLEGSRVFLVEVQALVEKTSYGTPIRRSSGFDQNRLLLLCAILSRRAGLSLSDQDVFVNVVGGMEINEPAADLAVAAAILGAAKNRVDHVPTVYLGEVGLGGEVRGIPNLERRLKEALRLGIGKAVVPTSGKGGEGQRSPIAPSDGAKGEGMEVKGVKLIRDI